MDTCVLNKLNHWQPVRNEVMLKFACRGNVDQFLAKIFLAERNVAIYSNINPRTDVLLDYSLGVYSEFGTKI